MEEVLKMTKEKDPPILVKFGPQSNEYLYRHSGIWPTVHDY